MGLLDAILGTSNPIAQWADQNKPTLSAIGAGLGTGTNFGQGLGIGAQLIPQYQQQQREYDLQNTAQQAQLGQIQYERQLQQNQLALAAQGRNATAEWAKSQGYSPGVIAAAQSGAIAWPDLFKRTSVAPGSVSVLDIPPDGTPQGVPAGAQQQPTSPPGATSGPLPGLSSVAPVAPVLPPSPVTSSPLSPPTVGDRVQQAFASGNVTQGPPALPIPTAAPQQQPAPVPLAAPAPPPQLAAPPSAPQYPRGTITNGATNPMDMTPAQRQALGNQYGLTGSALAAFTVSGRLPSSLAMGMALDQTGPDGAPLGTTGQSAIDPTAPGYSSKPVVAGLTQAAIDQQALNYAMSGGHPPVGRTGVAGQQAAAISNRMAELDPSGNLAVNKAQLKSLTASLANQQKYADTTERSITNAENGFQQVVSTFQGKVNASQYPSVNAAANALAAQLNPGDITAYKSGLQEVANEYAQVFSRGGVVTDAVRSRSQAIANGDLSLPDLNKVLTELQAQGNIVVQGSKDQVKKITNQINGIVGGAPPATDTTATATASPAAPGAPKAGDVMGGYRFKGGDPSQQANWEAVK